MSDPARDQRNYLKPAEVIAYFEWRQAEIRRLVAEQDSLVVWSRGEIRRVDPETLRFFRLGVSAASACRWAGRMRWDGHVAPTPSGGDQVSHRVEAQAGLILATCKRQPTIVLRELRDGMAGHGLHTSTSRPSRFFARHGITRKRGGPRKRAGPAGRSGGTPGLVRRPARP